MLNLVKPKFVIPLHGEIRQQKMHARLAEQMGIPSKNITVIDNGQVVELQKERMKLGEKVPTEYIYVDGAGVGDISSDIVHEREAMVKDGIILVNLILSEKSNELVRPPEITSHGFMMPEEACEIYALASQEVANAVSRANGHMEKTIVKALRTFLYNETRRSPKIFVNTTKI